MDKKNFDFLKQINFHFQEFDFDLKFEILKNKKKYFILIP